MTIPLKHRPDGLGEFENGDAVPVWHGGTGATTVAEAQDVLGITSKAEQADLVAVQETLTNLTEEVDTKADEQAVNQALMTKADLVDGKVPASQLPSYVDDVLEGRYVDPSTFNDLNGNPYTPATGVVYVDVDTNKTYRWSGMLYVVIGGGGVALGETSETAYRGDRGKVAYDHSQSQGNPHNSTTSDIPEGVRLYYTEARSRATPLTGLSTATGGVITAADSYLSAFGKLQNQISNAGGMVWVDVTTIPSFTYDSAIEASQTKIQLCKFGGMVWIRGYVRFRANVTANAEVFALYNASWLPDAAFIPDVRIGTVNLSNSSLIVPLSTNWVSIQNKFNMATNGTAIAINTSYHIPPIALYKHT